MAVLLGHVGTAVAVDLGAGGVRVGAALVAGDSEILGKEELPCTGPSAGGGLGVAETASRGGFVSCRSLPKQRRGRTGIRTPGFRFSSLSDY